MATGKLGTVDLAAETLTTIYTVPATKIASFTISLCNRMGVPVNVRIAESTSETPALSEYIEYDVYVPAQGVLERTGRVLGESATVVAYASATGVSININGYEE
jgi:hypothetical protein